MPYKIRTKQNKDKKEKKDPRISEYYEIRKENQKLKRENARLRKSFQKYDVKIEKEESFEEVKIPQGPVCINCKSNNLQSLLIGTKNIIICKDCKVRRVENATH